MTASPRHGAGTGRPGRQRHACRGAREPATLPDRSMGLEDQLRLIAREVEAAGVTAGLGRMPTALEFPILAELSSRELEIVARLLQGDRVPVIARSLFLSESTVRNHLTSVYRKLNVASQQELLLARRFAPAGLDESGVSAYFRLRNAGR